MSFQLTGVVKQIHETEVKSPKFKTRKIWIDNTDNPQYPSVVEFEFKQDKTDILNPIAEGQEVTVSFNVGGREWSPTDGRPAKVFNCLSGWGIKTTVPVAPVEPAF